MVAEVTPLLSEQALEERWFMRVSEAARLTAISEKTIYAAIYAGQLKAHKFRSRRWLIRREDLEAWIESESTPNTA